MNSKADVNKGDGQGMAKGLEVPPNPEVVPRATSSPLSSRGLGSWAEHGC
jgi:hypothetical protein